MLQRAVTPPLLLGGSDDTLILTLALTLALTLTLSLTLT